MKFGCTIHRAAVFFYAKNHPFFNYSPQIPIGKNFSLLTIKKYFVNL